MWRVEIVALVVACAGCSLALGIDDPQELVLDRLAISDGVLVPAFSPEITSYTVSLPPTNTLGIVAETTDEDATITIGGQPGESGAELAVPVRPGVRRIAIAVVSPTGVTATYQITATIAGTDFETDPSQNTAVGSQPRALASGDFDRDGNRDVVIGAMGQLQVQIGRGDGLFDMQNLGASSGLAVAVADLDGDTFDDIVAVAIGDAAGTGDVLVFGGNGDGTFDPPIKQNLPVAGSGVAIGELNGDAHLDLAVTTPSNNVQVLLGNSQLGVPFTQGAPTNTLNDPSSIALGNVRGNAATDIVLTHPDSSGLNILENSGTGTFDTNSTEFFSVPTPESIVLADMIGGPELDFVVALGDSQRVEIHSVNTPGDAGDETVIPLGRLARRIAVGQLDGDGKLDIVVASDQGEVLVLFSTPTGFAPVAFPVTETFATTTALLLDDFNGDGQLDIASINEPTNQLGVLLGVRP